MMSISPTSASASPVDVGHSQLAELGLMGPGAEHRDRDPVVGVPLDDARMAGNTLGWLGWQDSNLRMAVPKTAALPLGYTPPGRQAHTPE